MKKYKIKNKNKNNKKRKKRVLNKEAESKQYIENIQSKIKDGDVAENIIGVLSKKSNSFGFLNPFSIEDEYMYSKLLDYEKAKIKDFEKTKEKIYISGDNLSLANNGDIVSIKNYKPSEGVNSAEAEIDKIIARNRKLIVGTLRKNKNFSFVVPDDKTFISDIFISKSKDMNARDEDKVLVEIISYGKEKSKKTEGRVVKILGNINDPDIILKSILADNEIEIEFPEKALSELKNVKETLSLEEVQSALEKGRYDLRNLKNSSNETLRFYTIDGEDAKDLDDAVAIDKVNGMYKIYISIADVSHYIKEKSELDKEAFRRSNSMYLLNTVIPMLPKKISNGICSLNSGEDKLTYTVEVLVNASGEFVKYAIYESINNIDKRLSYNLVEEILDNPNIKNEDLKHNILKLDLDYIDRKNIEYLKDVCNILKKKRDKNGYINFDLPESVIEVDEEGKAIDIKREEELFSNEIIEHLMLTANEVVASIVMEKGAPSVYRIHENPDIEKVKEVNEALSSVGVSINISKRKNSEGIPEEYIKSSEYQRVLIEIEKKLKLDDENYWKNLNEPENKERAEAIYRMLQYLMLRSMKKARYSRKPEGHFGIGSKNYLHFTAPIRRYSDLFVHRALKKFIKDKGKTFKKTNDLNLYYELADIVADKCSAKERKTLEIERKYTAIKKAEYMEDKIGEIYTGIITKVIKNGMFVELKNTVDGFIRFEDMKDYYIFLNGKVIGEKYNLEYKVGDIVEVMVSKVNVPEAQIDFVMTSETEDINNKRN